ncbi:uncharacterized protein LOC142583571 [Dermacentor variabilis]|uniref:uncharacterized protein LOC142583571 n=1 Tax=Dermacentor variabilis TaxID=34621 RepID=UPI003F5B849E
MVHAWPVCASQVSASTPQSGHQRDNNCAAFVFFWLTGIAFRGVLWFACVVRAYSDASVGAGPHPPPVLAPMAPPEQTAPQGPGSTIRSPEESITLPIAAAPPKPLSTKARLINIDNFSLP